MADKRKDIENIDEVPGRTQTKHCQPCGRKNANNVADVYCEDCGEYQCNECSKVHQHFPVMATHKLMNISDAQFKSRRYDMKGLDLCKQHEEILKFFCEDENKLCCSTCAIVKHRKCNSVVEFEKKTKVGGPSLVTLERVLLDIDSKAKTFQHSISETRELLVRGETEIVGKIQNMQDQVLKMFEELKRKVSHDICTFKEQVTKDLDTKVASCDNYVADVEKYLSDIANITEQGTPIQQMIMFHYLKDQVRQMQENTSKVMEEFKDVRMTFDFDDVLKPSPSMSAMPGRLILEYLTASDSQGDGKEKQHKEQKFNLKLLASIDLKKGEGDVENPFYTGLDFLPDGRLIAVDNSNKKCLVYKEQFQLVRSFALPNFPQDVVAVSGDEVGVTAAKAKLIQLIKILDNNKLSLKESRNETVKCGSISVIDNDLLSVGTIDTPLPVRIVSMSGEEKELGINFITKGYPVGDRCCTYIRNYNKVVLSDRLAHTVYIYDIASNTKVEVKDKTIIKEPRGVAVGPDDCIFVCSKLTNTLVQISHTGQILSSHALDLLYPLSVSVSKDNTKIAVSNSCFGKKSCRCTALRSSNNIIALVFMYLLWKDSEYRSL